MKLLAASADAGSVLTSIRIERPLRLGIETRQGWALRLRPIHDCSAADLEWADVLILQRGMTHRALRLISAMHASGGKVIFEIDDLLTEMPQSLIHHAAVQHRLSWLRQCLAAADVVSVSTARLGRSLGVPRWIEVPNYGDVAPLHHASAEPPIAPPLAPPLAPPIAPLIAPPIEPPIEPPTAPSTDAPAGALAGGQAARDSLPSFILASSDHVPVAEVAAALRELQARPGRLGPVLAIGPVADNLAQAGVVLRAIAPVPRADFLRLIRHSGPLLALIPLGSTDFDACKSAIKYFDYALARVPSLCARRPPYSDVIEDGVDGLLVEDRAAAWLAAMEAALDDPQRTAGLALAAADKVATRYALSHCVAAWMGLLESLGPRATSSRPAMNPLQRTLDDLGRWASRWNRQRLALRSARRSPRAGALSAQRRWLRP